MQCRYGVGQGAQSASEDLPIALYLTLLIETLEVIFCDSKVLTKALEVTVSYSKVLIKR